MNKKLRHFLASGLTKPRLRRYVQASLLLGAASLIGVGVTGLGLFVKVSSTYLADATNLLPMVYLLAVVVAALYLGRGPSIFVALGSMFIFDYLFVPPKYSFEVEDTRYIFTFTVLLVVGLVISQLTAQVKAREAQVRQTELLQAAEKLQSALLNSLSHDLRTPLVSITGVLSTLQEDDELLNAENRRSLVETAREEAERLNRLVSNLLDMTRLESGAIRLVKTPGDVQDLISSVLETFQGRLEGREIRIQAAPNTPLIPMDFVLMVHALSNILDNALKYSPPGSPLDIEVDSSGSWVEIRVLDRGSGIPLEDLPHVFDKFFRVRRPESVSGTGLGLSISRGLVEAHGGSISAHNRSGGGSVIGMRLPAR